MDPVSAPDALSEVLAKLPVEIDGPDTRDFSGLNPLGYQHVSQVSKLLCKSEWQLWDEHRRGVGPPRLRYGNLVLYKTVDIQKFLDSLIERPLKPHAPKPRKATKR